MIVALLLLLIIQPAEAKSKMSQFQLYTRCLGVHLIVGVLPENAEQINLTMEQITMIVKNRLQAARLYVPRKFVVCETEDIHPILYVQVNTSKTAFSIGIELRKIVLDDYSGMKEYAVTWRIGVVGVHGRRNKFILRMVDKYTSMFIKEWRKVNESECLEKEKVVEPGQGPVQLPKRIR